MSRNFLAAAVLSALSVPAQVSIQSQFSLSGTHVSLCYAPISDTVFAYSSFGATINEYSTTGTLLNSIARPGGAANDADLEIAPVPFVLGTTAVPQGSLLYIDGESGVAEIYAMDPTTGAVLGSLTTGFGNSHVVGGGFHEQRGTFFLVQDQVPGASERNRVAEVDPVTGAVLQSWQTTASMPTFAVNYGDLDVTHNGNLLIVSSIESEIGQFTPTGQWVYGAPLPAGAGALSGIGVDETGCELWTIATNGTVSRLSAPCPTVTVVGPGCGGHVLTYNLPWSGQTWTVTAGSLPAISFAIAVLGLTQITPIPISSLAPQGQPGCNVHVSAEAPLFVPVVGGVGSAQVILPPGAWTIGTSFHFQMGVFALDASNQVTAITATDALRATAGSY